MLDKIIAAIATTLALGHAAEKIKSS